MALPISDNTVNDDDDVPFEHASFDSPIPDYYSGLPESIRIGQREWTIELLGKTAHDEAELAGFTDMFYQTDRILLRRHMSHGALRATLMHEIMHAILFVFEGSTKPARKDDVAHYYIGLLDEHLLMVLRDNPDLQDFLLK